MHNWRKVTVIYYNRGGTLVKVMDLETKLLYSQLKRIREAIDTAEQLDYTSYCTVHLWKVFYEYERQLHNHINPPTLHKGGPSWVWRTTVHRLLRPRIIHHFTTWQWGITHRLSDGMERHPPNWQVTGFTMKYAVILKRTKKHNKISTKRLTFFSLDDAAHYERNIKLHDPKVIHTELIPDFSWKQSSTYWTTTLLFIWIRNAKVSTGTTMVLIFPMVLSAMINRHLPMLKHIHCMVRPTKHSWWTTDHGLAL